MPTTVRSLTLVAAITCVHASAGSQDAPPVEPPAPESAPAADAAPEVEAEAEVDAGPRPVEPADYGQWESLGRSVLSPDGRWIAYGVSRVDRDGELRVRMLATEEVKVFEHASGPVFSDDSEWLAWRAGVSRDERKKLEKQKKPVRNGLGLLGLRDGTESTIDDVQSFAFSDDGRFLVMRRYKVSGRKSAGSDLVLRDLESGADTNLGNVSSWSFNEDGLLLAMIIDAEGKAGNGVQLYDAATGALRTLESHDAVYKSLTWREESSDLAVMREMEHEDDEDVSHTIVAWTGLDADVPREYVYAHERDEAFPAGVRVSELAGLRWADDGAALFFGVKAWEKAPEWVGGGEDGDGDEDAGEDEDEGGDEGGDGDGGGDEGGDEGKGKGKGEGTGTGGGKSEGDVPLRESLEEASNVEVWHADDVDILPRQKRTASQDERRSDLGAYLLTEQRFVRLGDELTENIRLLDGQKRTIGLDNTPYEEEKRFGPTRYDVHVVDVATGEKTKILEGVKYQLGGDPTGRHLLYVRDEHIWTYDLDTGEPRNLTADAGVPFINQERSSLTDEKPPYGVGGWTEDGAHVLLYDRYDMYLFAVDGSGFTRLTHGSDEAVRHRRQIVDPEDDEFVPRDTAMLVSLYGDRTKRSGYGRLSPDGRLERLVYEPASIGRLGRADDADTWTFVRQTYEDSPDVFVTDASLEEARQVTETNPFQSDYLWGRAELIDYQSANGDALQGALYYPADYEPGKQYPMIVDIYELRSQGLHRYARPSETRAYNTAVFSAEGYFVYTPDIVYRAQNPGLSAVECVVPAVEAVLATGMVDRERIGLVGHSWGAYQTAFIVTQTDLFAAGVAGAPLTNMMSMSMSIYWNSGQSDAWIFHESQGRMDRPFWNDVDTYIKNSPIFSIERMTTPLMIAFGTEDGAVDFNQGVEMYNAARLARKPFVMLVYPGENHGLRREENQVDYHYRILEWFGHYLKGAAAETWITEGQSWLDRQREIEDQKKK